MGLETMRVLYKHRLELGKPVDDILKRYPELAKKEVKIIDDETPAETEKGAESSQKGKGKVKKHGKKSKG